MRAWSAEVSFRIDATVELCWRPPDIGQLQPFKASSEFSPGRVCERQLYGDEAGKFVG